MGKYMRKANVSGEVAVMEVAHQSGVRTRARSLAAEAAAAASREASRAYLELRSRRLEKPLLLPACSSSPCRSPGAGASSRKPGIRPGTDSGLLGSVPGKRCSVETTPPVEMAPDSEVSSGENIPEGNARDRYARETTPCSLIMDPENTRTPGSTNRPSISRAITRQTQVQHNIPNSREMEEFFADAEQLQQQIFVERYNFDPVNELPLPGRYEWVKVDF